MKLLLIILLLSSISHANEISVLEIDTGVSSRLGIFENHMAQKDGFDYEDINGHGTEIAYIILKDTCLEVKLTSCRYYNFINQSDKTLYSNCLNRITNNHYDYINMSLGGTEFREDEYNAIQMATNAGTIVNVAAGNNGKDLGNPCYGYWPACDFITNMNVVGSKHNIFISKFSNYGISGMKWEDGEQMPTINRMGQPTYMWGTSSATATYTNRLLKEKCDLIRNKPRRDK